MKLFDIYGTLGIDTSQFEADIKAAQDEAQQLENVLNDVDSTDVDISNQRRKFVQSMGQMVDSVEDLDRELAKVDGTMSIDTSQFESDIEAVQREAQQLENVLNDVNSTDLDISKQLRKWVQAMKQMVDSVEDLDRELAKVENSVDDVDVSKVGEKTSIASQMAQGALGGLAEAGKDLLGDAVDWMIDFVGKSLEYVAKMDTETGKMLRRSNKEWEYTEQVVMTRVGEWLAPVVVALRSVVESLLGVTDLDKVNMAAKELSEYKYENFKLLKENLKSIYGIFEKVTIDYENMPKPSDLIEGLRSQEKYWAEYGALLQSLKDKGMDDGLLSLIADGSASSMSTLRALNDASEEELTAIQLSYGKVVTLRESVADGINESQMAVDDTVKTMEETIAGLVAGASADDLYMINYERGKAIADGLAAAYPNIAAQVDNINSILASIGSIYNAPKTTEQILNMAIDERNRRKPNDTFVADDWVTQKVGIEFNAKGLNYVPYNDYVSRLHVGEAVLTRQQADQWRAGQDNGFDMGAFAEMLTANLSNSVAGLRVQMDGRTVGQLVSGTVSREIAKQSRRRLTSV